jgi:hypothetical protein
MMQKKTLLSTLWIVLTVNFIFCDVFTLMHAPDLKQLITGKVGEIELTQEFLLTFAIIMELPMLMILLARILKYKLNRILNIVFGILLCLIQIGSLSTGDVSLHYLFFSAVEILILLSIVWIAWKWKDGLDEKLQPN